MIKNAIVQCIYGRRGTGKTTGGKAIIKNDPKLVVFDPMHEYNGRGWVIIDNIMTTRCKKQLVQAVKSKTFKIAVCSNDNNDTPAELLEMVELLQKIQQPYKDGKNSDMIRVVVDEMSFSIPNIKTPLVNKIVKKLVNTGRHYGFNVIGLSQRPAQVHTDFRSGAMIDYYYCIAEPVDKEQIAKKVGKDIAEKIATLPNHSYIKYDNGEITSGKNKLK